MKNRKPRTVVTNLYIENGDSVDCIFDKRKQSISLGILRKEKSVRPSNIQLSKLYLRKKKPKVLNRIDFKKPNEFSINDSDAIKLFDQVWAIDTNKKDLFSRVANISAITVCSTDGHEVHYPVLAIVFGETTIHPETFGWRKFIEFVLNLNAYDPAHKYALIVDSELGNINAYNQKRMPICGNFYLPDNFQIIYATADAGKESIFNKLIGQSDKVSASLLETVSKNDNNAKYFMPVEDIENHSVAYVDINIMNG